MNERRAERIAMTPPANPVSVVGARINLADEARDRLQDALPRRAE